VEHIWSVLCQQPLINEETKTISLIETVERVTFRFAKNPKTEALRAIPLSIVLVSTWWRSEPEMPESGKMRVLVQDPDGNELKALKSPVVVIDLNNSLRFRANLHFQNLPFVKTGIYKVMVQSEKNSRWKNVAILPIELIEDVAENTVDI